MHAAMRHTVSFYSTRPQIEMKNFKYTVGSKVAGPKTQIANVYPKFGDFMEGGFNNGEVRPTRS